jgi:hypothetical protein
MQKVRELTPNQLNLDRYRALPPFLAGIPIGVRPTMKQHVRPV